MKSWQASPLSNRGELSELSVSIERDPANSRNGERHAAIQIGANSATSGGDDRLRAILSQEVRSPRAGRFTFAVQAAACCENEAFFREEFLRQYTCKLVIIGFLDLKKNHTEHRVFATTEFTPSWSPDGKPNYERFEVAAQLRSQEAGAMETSRGIAVAVIVERKTPAVASKAANQPEVLIRIDDVELTFGAKPRNEKVTV